MTRKVTHICCLITGDRFYLADDESRLVWEVRFHSTDISTGKKTSKCRRDDGATETFNSNKVVVHVGRRSTKDLVMQPALFDVMAVNPRKQKRLFHHS